jgi:predicted RNA-binding Zn ribbon-like protein
MAESVAGQLDLRAGHAAVDFVNTVVWRGDPARRVDHLLDYADLVAWCHHASVLTSAEARDLMLAPTGEARRVLTRAKQLREALHQMWVARPSDSSAVIDDAYRAALRNRRLDVAGDAVTWADDLSPRMPVDRIAVAAVELLTSMALSRVRQCGDGACGWLFLDTSHRGNRRWCSAADCGNRDRARRHYERTTRR